MKRSLSLDFLKVFLSFFVVVAHLQPLFYKDALEGWLFTNGLCRVLVPCFLMISGFFLYSKLDDIKSLAKYLGQLLIVYAVWSLFYLYFYYEGTGIVTILGRLLFGYFHLWYLPALFSGVIIFSLLRKVIKSDILMIIIIFLLYLTGHILDPTRGMAHYYRNGLFIGFPFLAFGYYIRKYNLKDLFTTVQLVLIIIASMATLMLEAYLYYMDGLKVTDLYLSALILCPAAIILCLKHPCKVENSTFTEYFSDLPTGIYYVHLFFVFKLYSVDYNIYNILPIFILSALVTIPIIYLNRRLKVRVFL